MHKALYPRDDVDRLYVSRKEGGRGLASIEDSVDASIQRLEDYIQKHEEDWNMLVTITPIVIGAFGTVTKGLLKGLEDLEVGGRVGAVQTTALLRSDRIVRRVLEI